MKLKTKTQNIFVVSMKIWRLFYTLWNFVTLTRKQSVYKSRMLLKKNWVLVFSFMYLVSLDPMDRSKVSNDLNKIGLPMSWSFNCVTLLAIKLVA